MAKIEREPQLTAQTHTYRSQQAGIICQRLLADQAFAASRTTPIASRGANLWPLRRWRECLSADQSPGLCRYVTAPKEMLQERLRLTNNFGIITDDSALAQESYAQRDDQAETSSDSDSDSDSGSNSGSARLSDSDNDSQHILEDFRRHEYRGMSLTL